MGLPVQTAMIIDDDDDLNVFAGKYFKDQEDTCIVVYILCRKLKIALPI